MRAGPRGSSRRRAAYQRLYARTISGFDRNAVRDAADCSADASFAGVRARLCADSRLRATSRSESRCRSSASSASSWKRKAGRTQAGCAPFHAPPRMTRSVPASRALRVRARVLASRGSYGAYQSATHSQTLPTMSWTPQRDLPFGKLPTGAVVRRSRRRRRTSRDRLIGIVVLLPPRDALLAARVEELRARRLVAPRVDASVGAARRELPLGLGREARALRLAVRPRLLPVDAVDRMLRARRSGSRDVAERIVDLRARAAVMPSQSFSFAARRQRAAIAARLVRRRRVTSSSSRQYGASLTWCGGLLVRSASFSSEPMKNSPPGMSIMPGGHVAAAAAPRRRRGRADGSRGAVGGAIAPSAVDRRRRAPMRTTPPPTSTRADGDDDEHATLRRALRAGAAATADATRRGRRCRAWPAAAASRSRAADRSAERRTARRAGCCASVGAARRGDRERARRDRATSGARAPRVAKRVPELARGLVALLRLHGERLQRRPPRPRRSRRDAERARRRARAGIRRRVRELHESRRRRAARVR